MGRLQQFCLVAVDDDTDNRELLSVVLEEEGAKVFAAASGLEALNLVINYQPDAVVSQKLLKNKRLLSFAFP